MLEESVERMRKNIVEYQDSIYYIIGNNGKISFREFLV